MKDSLKLLQMYLGHFIHHFGVRSPETAYIHGQIEARYATGNIMVPEEYTSTGHTCNPIGYHQLSISIFGSSFPGTQFLKHWIDENPLLAGMPMKADEMLVVYAIGRIGLVGIESKGDLLALLPK